MNKILEYAGQYKKNYFWSVTLVLLAVFAQVIPYLFLYKLIIHIIGIETYTTNQLISYVVIIAICLLLYTFLYTKGLELSHIAAYNTLKNLRIYLQERMEKMPLGAITAIGNGTFKKMFVDDIETLELLLAHAIPELTANTLVPLLTLITVFIVDWRLGLLSIASLVLGVLPMCMMFGIGAKYMEDYYASARDMNNTIIEYVNGMEVIKVFNHDVKSFTKFTQKVLAYRDFTLRWYKMCWPWMALYASMIPFISMFSLPVGTYLVLIGKLSFARFILVICLSTSIGAPLLRAMNFGGKAPEVMHKINELEKLTSAEPLKETGDTFHGKNMDIVYDHVTFSYEEETVIDQLSLTAKQGELVALVGESGSGKSTLAKLLVHFYDISSGKITIGGQDITQMSLESLNQLISYVAQEQFLFNTSILENVRIGRPDATDDEVMNALERAQCLDFIENLPKGVHTMAGDSGNKLSGGERQRISLARALLKDAPIIILDEATAFIDPENEEKMSQAISEIIKNKTVILIAHKLSSIVGADRIYVLKNGKVLASGKHDKLLANCETYQKLYQISEDTNNWKVSSEVVLYV